ncbi:hypothetical protein BN2475_300005 [Paraburkholderia ribeironis]|uniref:Uncharacterized protein n=1 Tax=Paraburkholderia ribeironis TaxID=1247936 RepID=A0A1N7S1Y4_9BURK|nr:hypothetical protein BN2475_300005 [Paraburkholderia ribeironis]
MQYLLSGHIGNLPVENQQIEGLSPECVNQSLPSGKLMTAVAGRRQRIRDENSLNRIVFKYRNSHDSPSDHSPTVAARVFLLLAILGAFPHVNHLIQTR